MGIVELIEEGQVVSIHLLAPETRWWQRMVLDVGHNVVFMFVYYLFLSSVQNGNMQPCAKGGVLFQYTYVYMSEPIVGNHIFMTE